MTDKVALMLDVDGVINVFQPLTWGEELTVARCGRTLIRYNQGLIDWLVSPAVQEAVQIVWCTTWNYYPDQLTALEDLTGIRGPRAFNDRPAHLTWGDMKVNAVCDALLEYPRVIWIDDDEVDAARKLIPAIEVAESAHRLLLMEPVSRQGLGVGHAALIEAWLKIGSS